MAKVIFKNQTANLSVDTYDGKPIYANGNLQVDVSGVLDGADVITWLKGALDDKTWIRTCTWLPSKGDAFDEGTGAGRELINNRALIFEVRNASAGTNINLQFDVE